MWDTQGGVFETFATTTLEKMQLPQFTMKRNFSHTWHLFNKRKNDRYDAIIGRDLQQNLGIDVLNSKKAFSWLGIEVDFRPMGYWNKNLMKNFCNTKKEHEESYKAIEILDANYTIPDLNHISIAQDHLQDSEKSALSQLLISFKDLFQARPGQWKGHPINIELKEGAKPQNQPPYRIPQAHMKALKTEITRLEGLGVLSKVEESEWSSPTFCIPKKDGTIRVLHDFIFFF